MNDTFRRVLKGTLNFFLWLFIFLLCFAVAAAAMFLIASAIYMAVQNGIYKAALDYPTALKALWDIIVGLIK